MSIQTKARKIGNSVGIIIPKEALEQMNLRDGDSVYLTLSGDGAYRITPFDPEFGRQMQASDSVIARYRNALKELAK